MSEIKLTVEEIKSLMDKMAQTGLGQLVLEDGDFKLKLAAQKEQVVVAPIGAAETSSQAVVPVVSNKAEVSVNVDTGNQQIEGTVVKSPIVGTFYSAPSPDKDPFAPVGKKVQKGDVLFIIESMKLMNEVQSEWNGEVAEVLVKDGEPVEYDQPIMVLK